MEISIKKRSLPKNNTAQADDSLGSILEKSESSHDPIFVYKDKEFLGLTSPYYAVFKKRYPRSTKALQAAVMPPHITINASIYEVAEHMLSTKMYSLPIFTDGKVDGIVTANDILKDILNNSVLDKTDIEVATPITINENALVKEAHAKMKQKKISRLIVVDKKGQLKGVLSRRDLQEAFTTPSRKKRFGKGRVPHRTWSFDEEKLKRQDYPIHEFYRVHTVTVEEGTSSKKTLSIMLDNKVGSVIFINEKNEPTGIVSTHTFLKSLAGLTPTKVANIILTDKHNVLSDANRQSIQISLQKLAKKIEKREHIFQIEATVDEKRNSAGRVNQYEVSLNVILDKLQDIHTKVTAENLKKTIQAAIKKIESQLANTH